MGSFTSLEPCTRKKGGSRFRTDRETAYVQLLPVSDARARRARRWQAPCPPTRRPVLWLRPAHLPCRPKPGCRPGLRGGAGRGAELPVSRRLWHHGRFSYHIQPATVFAARMHVPLRAATTANDFCSPGCAQVALVAMQGRHSPMAQRPSTYSRRDRPLAAVGRVAGQEGGGFARRARQPARRCWWRHATARGARCMCAAAAPGAVQTGSS